MKIGDILFIPLYIILSNLLVNLKYAFFFNYKHIILTNLIAIGQAIILANKIQKY